MYRERDMCAYICIYIYTYACTYRERERERDLLSRACRPPVPQTHTNNDND